VEAAAHSPDHHEHHEMPTSGRALTSVAFSATLHCLTGCAIGEILGMAIGTALGFSNSATIALAVVLAFFFGYLLTSIPLLRAGLAFSAVVPIAFASDTVSIAIMEIVDNAIMVIVPGAMEAGINSLLFWGSLSVALVIAGAAALPVNRWLIARGKGHTAVHETGIHGGPPTRVVAAIAAVAAVFGTVVLVSEAVSGGKPAGHASGEHASRPMHSTAEPAAGVRGLAASANGLTLQLTTDKLSRGQTGDLRFRIVDSSGQPVRTFEVEHEKRMHLIVARRDLTGFQHLHPELASDGTWSTPVTIAEAGRYRVFADFKHGGRNETLAADLVVDGSADHRPLPPPSEIARTGDGYEVGIDGEAASGREADLRFTVRKAGETIAVEPYLGAGGHLVALREGDLAYLHVHPTGHAEGGEHGTGSVAFATEFPSPARYRLFLQFKHEGRVHTAAFTRHVDERRGRPAPDSAPGPEGGHDGH
jgi:Domain of unknown function (DUF4396)